MNIRKSLYWIVFVLAVVPFLAFSLLTVQVYSGRLEKVITESLKVVADAQIQEMTNFCEQQREYLSLIGATEVAQEAATGNLTQEGIRYVDDMLDSYVQMIHSMNTLAIIDENQRVVACSDQNHQDFAENGIDAIIASMGEQPFYISDVLLDAQGEKTLVLIARLEKGDELLGYTLGEISLDFYADVRERAELWNDSTLYILDGQQQIISAGTPDEDRASFVTTKEEREDYNEKYNSIDFEKNPQGSFQYKLGGTKYITYYSDMEYTDWRIMLTVNMDVQQTEQTIYFVMAAFLIFLCIVLALWLSFFASRRIVQPIQNISGILKEIQERQDYTLRVDIRHRDEMGNLAEEINRLIDFIETEDLYKMQQQRLLQEKAEQDALTKVLNKERIGSYLQEAIHRHSADADKIAVLFVDIDDFKAFNSNYGHNVGDQVLLFITALLAKETGGMVGRVGGDEFLVVVENVQGLDENLTRVKEAAESQFIARGSDAQLPVSCCIGAIIIDFATAGSQELSPDYLIHLADNAMYQVKNGGKHGHVIWDLEKAQELDGTEK